MIRSKIIVDGSSWEKVEPGTVRGMKKVHMGLVEFAFQLEAPPSAIFFPQLLYLLVFHLSSFKALIMALDRFTCFIFFSRDAVITGTSLTHHLVLFPTPMATLIFY